MKKIISVIIMTVMLTTLIASCSKSSEDEPRLYPTEAEIQGRWGCVGEYASYIITFDKPNYTTYIKSGKNSEIERGTYTMNSMGVIVLTPYNGKESSWTDFEVYWDTPSKTFLHIYPLGSFTRLN